MLNPTFEIKVPRGNPDVPGDQPTITMEDDAEQEHNRIYIKIDNKFDLSIKRTEEGIIIDVYGGHDFFDLIDTLAVNDDQLEYGEANECGSSTSTEESTAPGTTNPTQKHT